VVVKENNRPINVDLENKQKGGGGHNNSFLQANIYNAQILTMHTK